MLDTIYDTLKGLLEWSLFLEFNQSEDIVEVFKTILK